MCDKICESRCSAVLIGAGMGNENMLTLDARTQIGKADACIGAVRLLEVCPKEKLKFAEYRSVEIIKIIKPHSTLNHICRKNRWGLDRPRLRESSLNILYTA